ncbi:hypothetical protein FIBSPDRAFT_567370 [Athelia psychrophila]|uniref:Uncharacterized protein n=1 Tax=Athelia psychrophila TaxID=1759441 RepID=A0A167TBF0_9AGAM|nr:hypothetical protein FIBSPDRAFT_567370 [Fibularhizoctonia sp. CBS 109695]
MPYRHLFLPATTSPRICEHEAKHIAAPRMLDVKKMKLGGKRPGGDATEDNSPSRLCRLPKRKVTVLLPITCRTRFSVSASFPSRSRCAIRSTVVATARHYNVDALCSESAAWATSMTRWISSAGAGTLPKMKIA